MAGWPSASKGRVQRQNDFENFGMACRRGQSVRVSSMVLAGVGCEDFLHVPLGAMH